jgi:hypothetical protein
MKEPTIPAKTSRWSSPRPSPAVPGCSDGTALRCGCGSLLAKLVGGAVELKCRRCKQTRRIPLEAG